MGQVAVTVNGRSYEIACDDGQEDHLVRLAGDIDQRVRGLVTSIGQVGEARLLLMAGLLIADELSDVRAHVLEPTADDENARSIRAIEDAISADIDALAQKIEAIASRLHPA
ncbi:MAG: cell division protein ZapA [Rhodospirillales bacterium]|nr:cell division protein ZapA [Rhodospirillales bacterium]